jgi:hypothetical protein
MLGIDLKEARVIREAIDEGSKQECKMAICLGATLRERGFFGSTFWFDREESLFKRIDAALAGVVPVKNLDYFISIDA